MRIIVFLLAAPLLCSADNSDCRRLESCAYTYFLPGRAAVFQMELRSQPGIRQSWDYSFQPKEQFRVSVMSPADAKFWILQDEGTGHLETVFPRVHELASRNDDDNFARRGQAEVFPKTGWHISFTSTTPVRLLLVLSHDALPDLEAMAPDEARNYLKRQAASGKVLFDEVPLHFR